MSDAGAPPQGEGDPALRQTIDDLLAVQARARRLRSCGDPREIVRLFAEAAREILGSQATQFYMRNSEDGRMTLHTRTGDTAVRRLGSEPYRPPDELLAWVEREARQATVPGEGGAPAHMLIPLVVAGTVRGILALDVEKLPEELPRQTVDNLTFLAEEAAAATFAAEEYANLGDRMGALARERSFLSNILDSITNGIIVVDLDARVLQINRNAATMLDLSTTDVVGQPLDPHLSGDLGVEVRALLDETLQAGFAMERLVTTRLDGAELPLAVGSSLMRDDTMNASGVVLVFRDMTASREMERLRQLDKMKSDFVANVSHELRTPLTSIKAYAEALIGMMKTAQQKEFLQVIDEESDRLLDLIEDLLNVSKIRSGTLKLDLETCDPAALLPEVLGVSRVQSKKHRIVTQVEAGLPKMALDRNRMKEVLLNLVTNAIKYSPKGGTVTVTMNVAAGNLHVDVTDEGIGISEKDQESLFQQFFRAETAHDAQVGGTGLGLAIVKGIAEAHGGTVRLKSAIGKGSTFSVILPVRHDAPRGEVASPF